MLLSDTTFLCGYFSIDPHRLNAKNEAAIFRDAGWTRFSYAADNVELLSNFYYPEFVNFSTETRRLYHKDCDTEITVSVKGPEGEFRPVKFRLKGIETGVYPYDIVMFSIKIEFENVEDRAVWAVLAKLRNCCFYEGSGLDEFIKAAIDPLKSLYSIAGLKKADLQDENCSYLVENGNKFKIFQIVRTPDLSDEYLYSCGTLAAYSPENPFASSWEYFEKVMSESRLFVFNNWKALMLLDSVTFCAREVSGFTAGIWEKDYFGMIYLYELYRKCWLYRQNMKFCDKSEKPSVLYDEIKEFERKYAFNFISYNFLPNEVDRAIEKNLETNAIKENVYHVINQEVEEMSAERESSTNIFLTFLTFVASFSAVWDISCLIDAMFSYDEAFDYTALGYRMVASILIALILIVLLFTRYKKRRK